MSTIVHLLRSIPYLTTACCVIPTINKPPFHASKNPDDVTCKRCKNTLLFRYLRSVQNDK